MQITCAGNQEAVAKKLVEAGADAIIDEGNLIINTRIGRELLTPEDVVTIEDTDRGKLVVVERTRDDNPDAKYGVGVAAS